MLTILFSDPHMLICRKPAGLPAQPDLSGQTNLLSLVQTEYPAAKLIHRLDTPTGGVMIFGLTAQATSKLSELVRDHVHFRKEYAAVVASSLPSFQGEMRDYLYHDKRQNKTFVVDSARKGAKEAVLTYRTVSTLPDGHTLLAVRLHTGRTHQIRVQLASRGFPLCGDGKYGSREKCPCLGLWAARLAFEHPITGKFISVAASPDTDLIPWSYFKDLWNDDLFIDT